MRKSGRRGASLQPKAIEEEIAHLGNLDLTGLRTRWHNEFGRPAPEHLTQYLLFRILAYKIQADRFGDLDADTLTVLDRAGGSDGEPSVISEKLTALDQRLFAPPAGTVLVREWDRKAHRVMVMPDGFAWNIPRSSTRQSSGRRSPPPRHQYRTAIPAPIGAGNARTLVSSPIRFRPSTDSSKIFQLLAVAAAVSLLHPSARGHQNESPPGLPAYTRYTPMR
jgi:hypothetical protein